MELSINDLHNIETALKYYQASVGSRPAMSELEARVTKQLKKCLGTGLSALYQLDKLSYEAVNNIVRE